MGKDKIKFIRDFIFNRNFALGVWLLNAIVFSVCWALKGSMSGYTVWKIMFYGSGIVLLFPFVFLVVFIVLFPFGLAYEDALDKQKRRRLPARNDETNRKSKNRNQKIFMNSEERIKL